MEPDPIDIDILLAPLESGDQGAGADLRSDYSASSPYQRLRDARSEARAEERAHDSEGDSEAPEPAAWRDVLSIGQTALASQTKDGRGRFFTLMVDELDRYFHGHETLYDLTPRTLANRFGR